MSDSYPLCKAAGLEIIRWDAVGDMHINFVYAKDVEAYLRAKEERMKVLAEELNASLKSAARAHVDEIMNRPSIEECMPKGDDRMSKMSDGFFKPEDFESGALSKNVSSAIAAEANRLLQERGVKYYCRQEDKVSFDDWTIHQNGNHTHFMIGTRLQPIDKAEIDWEKRALRAEEILETMIREVTALGEKVLEKV